MEDLTGFQRDILYVITGLDAPKGLAIKDELEEYYSKEIHHGRLYPNLDSLVEKGLVEKGQYNDRTNSYTLTQRGHREIKARREWEAAYHAGVPFVLLLLLQSIGVVDRDESPESSVEFWRTKRGNSPGVTVITELRF